MEQFYIPFKTYIHVSGTDTNTQCVKVTTTKQRQTTFLATGKNELNLPRTEAPPIPYWQVINKCLHLTNILTTSETQN
jgi:Tfp pilus assembly protein PilE